MKRNVGRKDAQLVALHTRVEDPTAVRMILDEGLVEYKKYREIFYGHSGRSFVYRAIDEINNLSADLKEYMTFPLHLLLWLYMLGADRERRRLLLTNIGIAVRHAETLSGTQGYTLTKEQYPITEALAAKLRNPRNTLRWTDSFDLCTLMGALAALGASAYARKTRLESDIVLEGMSGLDGALRKGLHDLPMEAGVDSQPLTFCYSWENKESNTCLFCSTHASTALLMFQAVIHAAAPLDKSHTTLLHRNELFTRLFMFLSRSNQDNLKLSKQASILYSNRFLW